MHELALAAEVLAIVTEASGGARVRRVVLEIGTLSAVLPDAVRFCFELAAEDTVADGARLDIVQTPGRGRCRGCGAEVAMSGPLERCGCGQSDLDWLAGQHVTIKEVEVA